MLGVEREPYLKPSFSRYAASIFGSAAVIFGILTGVGGAACYQYVNNQPLSFEQTATLTGLALWAAQNRRTDAQAVMTCLTQEMGISRLSQLNRGEYDRARKHLLRVGVGTSL